MSETETCARCGKTLEWHERKMVFWNKHLKKGYIRWYVIGSREWGSRKDFPQYMGKKLCQVCAHEVFTGENYTSAEPQQEPQASLPSDESIADFTALWALLDKQEVVGSAFKCPKCSGMLEIPKKGKLLICSHCGEPIKPADIYEKIKPLLE
ncbi:MAG: hypothetical protein NWE93_13060 [Candidatus Bathyarchaeota archaeon]|nr:hypothetical protein [Candidatus Bathyarchaeota archaeon]